MYQALHLHYLTWSSITLQGRFCNPHFTCEETEMQRRGVAFPHPSATKQQSQVSDSKTRLHHQHWSTSQMYLKVKDMLGSKMTVKKTWAAVGTHIQISWEHGKLKNIGRWMAVSTDQRRKLTGGTKFPTLILTSQPEHIKPQTTESQRSCGLQGLQISLRVEELGPSAVRVPRSVCVHLSVGGRTALTLCIQTSVACTHRIFYLRLHRVKEGVASGDNILQNRKMKFWGWSIKAYDFFLV